MVNFTPQEAAEYYSVYGSQRAAANAMGIPRRTFRRLLDKNTAAKYKIDEGFKVTKVSTVRDSEGHVTQTSVVTKLAPTEDHVVRDGKIARRSTLYGADGAVVQEWVIRKPEDAQDEYVEALKRYFVEGIRPFDFETDFTPVPPTDDVALFMSIDEHINVKVLADQCGQDYGLDDAVILMRRKFAEMVDRTPACSKAIFVNLGDQFHQNDHMSVTPASKHVLESDKSFYTASDAVVNLNISKINTLLKKFDTVEIHGVSGNHDIDPMGWLFRCLKLAFDGNPRVTVKFHPEEVFALQIGNTLLGFHHGHRMKPDTMAGVVADRFPKLYGNTTMRYLHTGHIHHDSVKDTWGGFKWHSHRTMAPKDWFSHSNGYISRQSMKSYIYNNVEGEVANFTVSLV